MQKLLVGLLAVALLNFAMQRACAQSTASNSFSFEVNAKTYTSAEGSPLRHEFRRPDPGQTTRGEIIFTNTSKDTLRLSNVVPFGRSEERVYITGLGDHRLSRTHLFLPGRKPVNVIVPDNAWELGYCSMRLNDTINLYGLTRRDVNSIKNGTRKRFETILPPGASVTYQFYTGTYQGDWQEGLRIAFQEKKLFDLPTFDNSLYKREDLRWIRKAYVMHLLMAWDKEFYDYTTGKFNLRAFAERGRKLYGGDDVICIWPTWPTLGVDSRNQFDMYRDLPGGLAAIRSVADSLRAIGTKFFIAYNPWDESTRSEGHLQGLAYLIRETSADGVVLDTKGESSRELQDAADKVKPGVVMYSEGMAVPKDMPGIVSGRVHNALYYPPMLNLNKLIRPDFAIFRVAEVWKEPIQREYAVAFFNGYGTEINQFPPGHPDWEAAQYKYLAKTTRILRENTSVFTDGKLTPLVQTSHDSIWVNRWDGGDKKLYTLFSLKPEGFNGTLFMTVPRKGFHFVDLWHHREITPKDGWIEAETAAFDKSRLGSNNEGEVDAIAELPEIISYHHRGNELTASAPRGELRLWAGNPDLEKESVRLRNGELVFLNEKFGRYEGKFVLQLFENSELLDEVVIPFRPGTARLVSKKETTRPADKVPQGMVPIPAGTFVFNPTHGDEFISYPYEDNGNKFEMRSFYMDKFPVTNSQFKNFLDASGYKPSVAENFLKHWKGGAPPRGEENFPVVYVSYEDAKAYAEWAGKRLPTEIEWQYAAQTPALNEWPWKQTKPVTRKEQYVNETLTVSALEGIDPKFCNLGNGKPYAVGKYPKGVNPFGLEDLVGCVWQLTQDVYENGSYRFIIMKGGSYFKPSSSWWYVQGGPRELHYRQYLLRVSQGFERNATVGFRCVADAPQK